MANLDFCNKHNMVAFLEKTERSEGFHQILDFLNSTHIKRIKTIIGASIMRHVKLEDSDGITTLPNAEIFKVKKLEHKVKTSQHKRKARVVIFDDEEDLEDPSKQGRKIFKIDENPSISLVQDEGTLWVQEDSEIQGRTSADTEILLDQEEPIELMEDLGSGEKGDKKISTVIPKVSTAAENLVVWDKIHAFIPMDYEIEKEVMKKSGFDLQQKQYAEEVSKKKDDNSSKSVRGSRKKTIAKKRIGAKLNEESAKRRKLKDVEEEATADYEKEKEELKLSLKIVHNDDSEVDYEPLSRKIPIVSWEYQLMGKIEAKDMEMIFDLDENDELWMNQLDWKLLRWKLRENYGVHTLFIDDATMEINMLVEKKYPLIKELLEKMLNLQLEVEKESTMAFKLIKFIKSLLEE
nr:hypothetical protein [Tanacetum cinerariifolium]